MVRAACGGGRGGRFGPAAGDRPEEAPQVENGRLAEPEKNSSLRPQFAPVESRIGNGSWAISNAFAQEETERTEKLKMKASARLWLGLRIRVCAGKDQAGYAVCHFRDVEIEE